MTTASHAALCACLLTVSAAAQHEVDGPHPFLRGWLLETLQLDGRGARAAYTAGANATDVDAPTRNLCIARLAEIDLEAGNPAGAARHLASLRAALPRITIEPPPVVEATPSRARSLVTQVLEASTAPSGRRRVDAERADRGARLGRLREWTEIVERHLDGRHAEADQLAWFALRWRPGPMPRDPQPLVDRCIERLVQIEHATAAASPQHAAVTRLIAELRALVAASDLVAAAELARRIPLPE